MTEYEFKNIMDNDIKLIEQAIEDYLPNGKSNQNIVVDAMKYSLQNGGKRIRPMLVIEFCKACGGDRRDALSLAVAIEYIHTYSLIHDDLPCMDNDDLRRGMPSCHKQFDENIALLAGDALLTTAFSVISDSDLTDLKKVKAISLLSQNSGVLGMLGGQVIDLIYEKGNPTIRDILTIHKLKTGALISAACILGCIAGGANDEMIKNASKFAYNLGIAFQIKDDILDVIGDEKKLGKPIGSDEQMGKTTYVTINGIEKSKNDVELLTQKACECLNSFDNVEFIKELAINLTKREY